jgi:ketosteroid isomerase-like protein
MTLEEAADRLAIQELIDAYAHCADRRDAKSQMALFTENTAFHVFMDSRSPEPTYILHGRDALAPIFEDLNQYQSTTHFNGQSTIRLEGDRAIGESYWHRSGTSINSSNRMAPGCLPSANPWSTGPTRGSRFLDVCRASSQRTLPRSLTLWALRHDGPSRLTCRLLGRISPTLFLAIG